MPHTFGPDRTSWPSDERVICVPSFSLLAFEDIQFCSRTHGPICVMALLSARILVPLTAVLLLSVVALSVQTTWHHQSSDTQAVNSISQSTLLDHNVPTQDNYPAHKSPLQNSSIGKCTSVYGEYSHEYGEALETHFRHNQIHRYPFHVLRQPILDGLWSKEAALLGLLLQELGRDETMQLRWLVWFDADAIIINPLIPLETFLPPTDMLGVQALVTEDWNGLNNGVFYLRVSAWNVEMLSAVIAYRTFKPDESLPFTEQSAMAAILRDPRFHLNVTVVSSTWFNAYPSEWSTNGISYQAKQGDMVLHFAGVNDKPSALRDWLLTIAKERNLWERPLADTTLVTQVRTFWENYKVA
ncbi:hypothetical protein Q7P35_008980 [Cladosporium inversicolor]